MSPARHSQNKGGEEGLLRGLSDGVKLLVRFRCFTCFLYRLQKLKARARGLSPDIRQIDLDVNRTYRDHIMFMNRYDIK